MPRPRRSAPGGYVYHVLNRGNARRAIFDKAADYAAFETILGEVQERIAMRILAWCLMPNHWHLVLWPREEGHLSDYMRLVTLTHAQRWHAHRASAGSGHLYQGRFKSFMVQDDAHFLTVCRYVEANALRANLVARAENWRWGSLWRACLGKGDRSPYIEHWPVQRPRDWMEFVNQPQTTTETNAVRHCVQCGTPYGEKAWAKEAANRLSLQCTLRPRGRPRKNQELFSAERKKGPDPFFISSPL